jgi:hypothetical protein
MIGEKLKLMVLNHPWSSQLEIVINNKKIKAIDLFSTQPKISEIYLRLT